MRQSRDQILTSHAGSLPRPEALIDANRARESGMETDERRFQGQLRTSVAEVVRLQKQAGIAIPGDGEFGKSMGHKVNYRAWWSYSFQRLGGLELGAAGLYDMPAHRSRPGEVVLTSFADRRDRLKFAAAYADPDSGITTGPRAALWPVCVGKLTYTGHAAIQSDIANFKAALQAAGIEEGFMTSIAPGSAARIANRHYKTDEEFLYACADAMREEYKAIVDAGSSCSSTIRRSPRTGTWSTRSRRWPTTRSSRWSVSRRSITPFAGYPRIEFDSISAGAAGMARTRRTFPCATSSR